MCVSISLCVRVFVCVRKYWSNFLVQKFANVFQCIEMNLICKISYNSWKVINAQALALGAPIQVSIFPFPPFPVHVVEVYSVVYIAFSLSFSHYSLFLSFPNGLCVKMSTTWHADCKVSQKQHWHQPYHLQQQKPTSKTATSECAWRPDTLYPNFEYLNVFWC